MSDENIKSTITELIDADEGLKSKRKLLTITSLILLALTFSGAKVEEANTFILKLKFENQNGIAILLVLAIVFLMIRYYNYAKPYHEKLFKGWSDRMLEDDFFHGASSNDKEVWGLIHVRAPKDAQDHQRAWDWYRYDYVCSWLFFRGFSYYWSDHNGDHHDYVSVGWKVYLKVILLEMKYQFQSYFTHRENLDILAPYFIGALAISSYFFHEQLNVVLNALSVSG